MNRGKSVSTWATFPLTSHEFRCRLTQNSLDKRYLFHLARLRPANAHLLGLDVVEAAAVQPDGGRVQDRRPGGAVVGPRRLHRVVGVERAAVVGELRVKL